MSQQAADTRAHDVPTHCENCAAELHGEFCHACGQSVHNPIRDVGHAVVEVFEAFWHLDGRLFRTLRDLWSPGRVAINYLAGHRARYIAPLRLFVVLSVLTFFIGAAAIHVGEDSANVAGIEEIDAATTVEEVERVRDRLIARIEAARTSAGNRPGVDPALVAAEARIQGAAANRVVQLRGGSATEAAGATGATGPADGATPPQPATGPLRLRIDLFGHEGDWHAQDNPLIVPWWPGFANDWLNRKLGNVERNLASLRNANADSWVQAMMSNAPTALFLLVPVFAVLLKVAYLFTGRVYLEHLVVALYSHVFLLLMLIVAFLLSALNSWVASTAGSAALVLGSMAVLAWMPVYLLLMQKRVYGQAWWLTVIKYLCIGCIYFMMLLVATLLMFLARLTAAA